MVKTMVLSTVHLLVVVTFRTSIRLDPELGVTSYFYVTSYLIKVTSNITSYLLCSLYNCLKSIQVTIVTNYSSYIVTML